MDSKRTAKENGERARQKELKNNPGGSLRDGVDGGAGNGNMTDIAGDMGWKGMVLLIVLLIAGYVSYQLFFN